MLRMVKGLAALALVTALTGCAMVASPVNGFIYTDVKGPLDVTAADASTKTGTAECSTILGLCATGDASIEAAAKAGGITKIHHVDFESWSLFGIYAKFKTIVHGS